MGKVLLLYDSASGKTARMATLLAEGAAPPLRGPIPGVEVRLRQVEEAMPEPEDVRWCDGLAPGSRPRTPGGGR